MMMTAGLVIAVLDSAGLVIAALDSAGLVIAMLDSAGLVISCQLSDEDEGLPPAFVLRPGRRRRIGRGIAQRTVRDHGGVIPDSYDGLVAMDGIGRYTAGAVLSFAFRQDAPILDTNVARLLGRYFGLKTPVKSAKRQRRLWQLAREVIPTGKGYIINQAMMDLGAMVCTARARRCPVCPLRRSCRSVSSDGDSRPHAA